MPKVPKAPDLAEFEKLSQRDQRRVCKMGAAIDQLTPKEVEEVQAALEAEDRVTVGGIMKWFEARGQVVSNAAINTHRAKRCKCNG